MSAALPTLPKQTLTVCSIPNTDLYHVLRHNFIIFLGINKKDPIYVCGVLTEPDDETKPYNERQLTQNERDLALEYRFVVNECRVLDAAYYRYNRVRKELFPDFQIPLTGIRDRTIRDEINKRYTIEQRVHTNLYKLFREDMLEWASIGERESDSEVSHYVDKKRNIIIVAKTLFAALVQILELVYQDHIMYDITYIYIYKNLYKHIVYRSPDKPLITKRDVIDFIFSGDGTLDPEWNLIQCQVSHFNPIPTVKSVSKS